MNIIELLEQLLKELNQDQLSDDESLCSFDCDAGFNEVTKFYRGVINEL